MNDMIVGVDLAKVCSSFTGPQPMEGQLSARKCPASSFCVFWLRILGRSSPWKLAAALIFGRGS